MKRMHKFVMTLIVLTIVGSMFLVMNMPDIVPAHYNFSGQVDRMGSKYELLMLPLIGIIMGVIMLFTARAQGSKGDTKGEKLLIYIALFSLLLFDSLTIFFGIAAINYNATPNNPINISIIRYMGIMMGIIILILGNYMPKFKKNNYFGLRIKWSMASDSLWLKSQRFSGFAAIICGVITIITSALLPLSRVLYGVLVLSLIFIITSLIASYIFYRKEMENKF